jgi:RNA polymerase sigma factor (sigma-70 family)
MLAGTRAAIERSDAELLKCFAAERNAAAFELLVQRHGALVLAVCRRVLTNSHDVEDAFQATFLVLAKKAGVTHWQESIAGWLHRVAHHVACQVRDAGKRHGATPFQTRCPVPDDPLSQVSGRELLSVLDEELGRIAEKYRAPLVLCYLEGLPRDAAARRLGCPLGTLKSRLERGRELLRRRLTKRGVSLPMATLVTVLAETSFGHAGFSLLSGTTQAALSFAAGSPAGASLRAIALAEAVLKCSLSAKLNAAIVLVLLLSTFVLSGGLMFYGGTGAQTPAIEGDKGGQKPALAGPAAAKDKHGRTDRYGDPLPPAALARMGSLRFHHGGLIKALAFAADGKSLVSGAWDGTIRMWNPVGKEVWRLRTPRRQGRVVVSRDGKLAVAADFAGAALQLIDAAAGKDVQTLQIKKAVVHAVSPVPGGKTVVAVLAKRGSDEPAIVVLDVSTGRELRRLKELRGQQPWQTALAVHGDTVASSDADGTVCLWNVDDGKALAQLAGHKGEVRGLDFSPAGDLLASGGDDGTVRVWNVAAGKQLRQQRLAKEQTYAVSAVCFSADGTTLAAAVAGEDPSSWTPGIHLWNVADWKEKQRMESPQRAVISALAFAPCGKLLASAGDSCIHRWDVGTGNEIDPQRQREVSPTGLSLAPDAMTLATTSNDGVIDLWEMASGRLLRQLRGAKGSGGSKVMFSAAGKRLISSSSDKTIRLWDGATGRELRRLSHPDLLGWMAVAPDGRTVASVGRDPVVRLWDMKTGNQLRTLDVHISPRPAGLPDQYYYPFDSLAISRDGKILAVAEQFGLFVHLFDLTSGKALQRIKARNRGFYGLAFSPDNRYLAAVEGTGQSAMSLFDVATGREVRQFGPPELFGPGIAFSPDGRMLFAGRRANAVRLYEVATGQIRHTLEGHQGDVLDGEFSADGKLLVTSSWDGTALVWDLGGRLQPRKLSRTELESGWSDLARADASRAYQTILAFAGSTKEAVAFLKERLPPIVPVEPVRMKPLLADLNSAEFSRREKAAKAIEALGFRAEPALREALSQRPSLEARRRIERLLANLDGPETLRLTRAIEALELIASTQARQHLRALAQGPPAARLTQEARSALQRLGKRPGGLMEIDR